MRRIRQISALAWRFMKKINTDKVRAYAAESSFFLIMSFFPFLMLLLTAIQFTPFSQEQVLQMIEELTPFAVSKELTDLVGSIYNESYALLSTTAVLAVWTSGKGVIGLADGLNSIYGLKETRNYVLIRIRAAFYMLLLLLALIVSIGILVFGYRLQELLRTLVPFIAKYPDSVLTLQMGISLLILAFLFTAFYAFLPSKKQRVRNQIPGALFTALAWAIFSYAFSIYLDFAVNMSVIYGSLATLIVVLLWLYSSMYLFFVGAEINCYLESPERFLRITERKS